MIPRARAVRRDIRGSGGGRGEDEEDGEEEDAVLVSSLLVAQRANDRPIGAATGTLFAALETPESDATLPRETAGVDAATTTQHFIVFCLLKRTRERG